MNADKAKKLKKYQIAAEKIRDLIKSKDLRNGEQLETFNQMVRTLAYSTTTVKRALEYLETNREIKAIHGSGYYVINNKNQKRDILIIKKKSVRGEPADDSLQQYCEKEKIKTRYLSPSEANLVLPKNKLILLDEYILQELKPEILKKNKTVIYNATFENRTISSVRLDLSYAMKLATSWLANKGHRKIAYFCPSNTRNREIEKLKGHLDGLNSSQIVLNTDHFRQLPWRDKAASRKIIRDFIKSHDRITAVICSTSYITIQVYNVLLESGRSIPDDISFMSFSSKENLGSDYNFISSIDPGHKQQGIKAVQFVQEMTLRANTVPSSRRIDPVITEGTTVKKNR